MDRVAMPPIVAINGTCWVLQSQLVLLSSAVKQHRMSSEMVGNGTFLRRSLIRRALHVVHRTLWRWITWRMPWPTWPSRLTPTTHLASLLQAAVWEVHSLDTLVDVTNDGSLDIFFLRGFGRSYLQSHEARSLFVWVPWNLSNLIQMVYAFTPTHLILVLASVIKCCHCVASWLLSRSASVRPRSSTSQFAESVGRTLRGVCVCVWMILRVCVVFLFDVCSDIVLDCSLNGSWLYVRVVFERCVVTTRGGW